MRVRFAPSPTGYLHIGNARTALFNYLLARSCGGEFILRIEDTDKERSTEEAYKAVLVSLKWLGMEWDEGPEKGGPHGPYFQSQRNDIYQDHLSRLLASSSIYPCFCTEEELSKRKERSGTGEQGFIYDGKCRDLAKDEAQVKKDQGLPFVYRFRSPEGDVVFADLVRGEVKVSASLFGDFVLVRSDGSPTYNFAVVVDDALMKITHILRGDDHISNTPKQVLIYQALNYPLPLFCHISMILGPNKEKLAKRHDATSILEFKEMGYLPEAFNNHLALLGWTPEDEQEIIPWEKLKKAFIKPKFHAAPAVFDYQKLDFLNSHYIKLLDPRQFQAKIQPYLENGGYGEFTQDREEFNKIAILIQERLSKFSDVCAEIAVFYQDTFNIAPEFEPVMAEAKPLFKLASLHFSQETSEEIAEHEFTALIKKAGDELNIKGKGFFQPMRLVLTGQEHGLDLTLFLGLLPRNRLLKRLERYL